MIAVVQARRLRVLLVIDEPIVRRAMRRALASSHDVFDIGEAGVALRYLAAHRVDVLVTAVQLPEMSGCVLAEQAASLQPRLRIALVTADVQAVDPRFRLRTPPIPVVPKPFDAMALCDAVHRAVALK